MEYLNYIESTGTQYIDTGYHVRDNSRFQLAARVSADNPIWSAMFGLKVVNEIAECIAFVKLDGADRYLICWGDYSGVDVGTLTPYYGQLLTADFSISRSILKVNGNTVYSTALSPHGSANTSIPIYIFTMNYNNTAPDVHMCSMKLYYFRILEGDALVADYRPALDDNGVACLYDTVSGAFKYNRGTGRFYYKTYDKDLFLSGVAVGRQLKGWGAVGSGGAAGYRNLDLRCWEKTRFSSPITFDGERNTVAFQAVSGYYERLYCPAMVKPHTNYRFSVEFSGTFEEGNSPGKTTYFAVTTQTMSDTYIENQEGIVLGKTRLISDQPGEYAVTFNSGERGHVYLYFDFAAIRDGTTVTLTYKNVSFREI